MDAKRIEEVRRALAECCARVDVNPHHVRSVQGPERDAIESRMESAFFARGAHPSTLYLSGFNVPSETVATRNEDSGAALQAEIARLASPGAPLFAYGDHVSAFLGPAEDVAKLVELPEVWGVEMMVMNVEMTWLIGFRHEELYLAGHACPPRGTA